MAGVVGKLPPLMKSVHCVARASTLLLSATLVGIAAELPLPTAQTLVSGFNPGGLAFNFRGFLSVADVNGDGLDDIVAPKAIYLQAADGSFAVNPAAGLVEYSSDVRIAIPDVTGDGAADFLVQTEFFDSQTQQTMRQVELHAGDPVTGLPKAPILASLSDAGSGLAAITPQVLDLNRNSAKDVAFVFSKSLIGPTVLAFMGNGGGSFASTPTDLTGYVSAPQLAIMLDQGQETLAVGSGSPNQVRLFTVNGGSPASTTLVSPTFPIQHLTSGKRSASGGPYASLVMQSGPSLQSASATARVFENGSSSPLSGAFWIVPDLTGDGLDDFVGRVTTNSGQGPVTTCGVLPTVAGSSQPDIAVERPFLEPLTTIELADGTGNPQFVPYAVGTGKDLAGNMLPHRLILAPVTGADLLGLASIAPTLVIGGGTISTPISLVYSVTSSPIQLFSAPQVALTFGDAASQVTRLSVTLTSQTADDQLLFTLPVGMSLAPTLSTSTTGANVNRVYTFNEAATVADYQSLLASMVYQSSAAPAGPATVEVSDFAARDRSTSASSSYGMPSVQLASLTFIGLPTITIPLLADATGHAQLGFNSDTAGASSANFTLAVVQQGLQGTGSIDATGQFFNYDQTNLQATGTDEVILSVFDDVALPPVGGVRGFRALQQEVGRIRIQITLTVATLSFFVVSGSTTMALGESVVIQVSQGIAPYQISANRATVILPVSVQAGAARGAVTSSQGFFIKPQEVGDTVITVRDVNGTSTQVTLTTALLASVEVPHPSVPASVGDKTVFGAICPGTPQGVSSLLAGLGRVDARQARGFTWDGATQRYVELPAQPGDGIGPTTGVFLAARADLGLDFSGAQLPINAEIILLPGWNFVGLGPVLDNGVTRTAHQLISDFQLILVDAQSSVAARDQIGDVAYLWNGATYEQTTTLQSNVGYWINNRRADGKALSLRRVANGTGFSARAESSADNVRLNAVGQPPTPPAASASSHDEGGHRCGSGSGIALVLGSLLAFARCMRFRR